MKTVKILKGLSVHSHGSVKKRRFFEDEVKQVDDEMYELLVNGGFAVDYYVVDAKDGKIKKKRKKI